MHKFLKIQLNNRKAHNFCRVIQENQTIGGIKELITTLKQGGYKRTFINSKQILEYSLYEGLGTKNNK